MAEKELELEDAGKKKGKMMIIIAAVAVLVIGGAAAFFLLGGSDEPTMDDSQAMSPTPGASDSAAVSNSAALGSALYVAMPRPFVFNVPGTGRDRLVEIKVQLLVRGADNEEQAKMHIPMIEGTLLRVFSSANADDLVTEAGKIALREQSIKEVKKVMQDIAGRDVVSQVLFTGFVMQ